MGTTIMGSNFRGPELNAGLWCALLEAVEQETKHSFPAHFEDGLQQDGMQQSEARSYGSWPGSDDEEDGDTLAILARLKATKRKREHTARVNVPGGPCMHCGVTESPQWRRPIDKEQVLCNACGIYYGRHRSLPWGKIKPSVPSIAPAPQPPVPRAPMLLSSQPAPHEILLQPLRAVRTRSPTTLKGRSPTSSESHNEAHARQEDEPGPSTTVHNPTKRTRTGLAPAAPATPAAVPGDALNVSQPLVSMSPLRRSPLATPSSPTDSSLSSQGHHNTFCGLDALAAATLNVVMKPEDGGEQLPTSRSQRLRRRAASAGPATHASSLPQLADGAPPLAALPDSMLGATSGLPTATSQMPLLLPVMRCQRSVHYRIHANVLLQHPAVVSSSVSAALPEPEPDVAPALVTPAVSAEPIAHPSIAEDETMIAGVSVTPLAQAPQSPVVGIASTVAPVLVASTSAATQPLQDGMILLQTLTCRGPRSRWRSSS